MCLADVAIAAQALRPTSRSLSSAALRGHYPAIVEIEIRSGFCDPDGELLVLLDSPCWRRINFRRRGEIVDEMVQLCDELGVSGVEAWRRRDRGSPQLLLGYWHPELRRCGRASSVPGQDFQSPPLD